MSINYEKTIIYKLCCKDTEIKECYVGSTIDFVDRKSEHKRCCTNELKKEYHTKKYQFIREHGGWDNWEMVIIENYKCNSSSEKRIRERYWTDKIDAELNMIKAHITKEEIKEENTIKCKTYYEENKEKFKETNKLYKENNKEKIKELQKTWYENNKESIKEKNETKKEDKKEYMKKWREENKEKIKEQRKTYYLTNNK